MVTFPLALSLLLVAALLALPALADVAALVRGRTRRPRLAIPTAEPRILFLVPAHDEELLIGRCLGSLRALDYPPDRLDVLVLADNCRDGTEGVARALGVGVLSRRDPARPGKPEALAWAFRTLGLDRWDAIVVLDADSFVDPGYARALARRAPLGDKVLQGYNDVSNPSASPLTRMASVFSAARALGMNEVKERAGLNSPLSNGFCIGTGVLARHPWRAFSLTEDWELYAILTAEGVPLENEPGARVFCQEARTLGESGSQRRRWSAGKLAVLTTRGPALLFSGRIGILQKLDGLAELTAPGPTVASLTALATAGLALGAGLPLAPWTASLATLCVARLGAYTAFGLTRVPDPWRTAAAFLHLPPYALWRIGVQFLALGTLLRGTWVRTARHHEAEPGR